MPPGHIYATAAYRSPRCVRPARPCGGRQLSQGRYGSEGYLNGGTVLPLAPVPNAETVRSRCQLSQEPWTGTGRLGVQVAPLRDRFTPPGSDFTTSGRTTNQLSDLNKRQTWRIRQITLLRDGAVLHAGRRPARRQHLDLHPPPARRAEPRRLQLARATTAQMLALAPVAAAAVTPDVDHRRYSVADSALTGICSSFSSSRSSLGERPSVVR